MLLTIKEIESDLKEIGSGEGKGLQGFLTVDEIANYLNCSRQTVYRWMAEASATQTVEKLGSGKYYYRSVAKFIFNKIYNSKAFVLQK